MAVGDEAGFPARRVYSRGRRNPLKARPEAGRKSSHSAPQRPRSPGSRLSAARRTSALAEHAGSRSPGCDQRARCPAAGSSPTRLCLGSLAGAFALDLTVRSAHTSFRLRRVNRLRSNFEVPAFPAPSPQQLSPAT